MQFQLTLKEGTFLVKLARRAVETYLKKGKVLTSPANVSPKLKEHCGVFVTINKEKELRGCIGLPYPTKTLVQGVIESAISSATHDPRFPSISLRELDHVVFEIACLRRPCQLKRRIQRSTVQRLRLGETD